MAKHKLTARETRLSHAASELRILVGEVIEALETYDSEDGRNALILAGVTAESRRIEDTYEDVLFTAAGRSLRRKARV